MEQLALFPQIPTSEPPVPRITPRRDQARMPMAGLESILTDLTEEQQAAVVHGQGPLLIVAGAGTGKTTVISRRIAYLIASRLALPGQILALTFTDKAAREMQERVDHLLPYGYADVAISTFHSFGDKTLRTHALELNISPDFRVLSGAEQVLFLRENLFALPLKRYRPLGNPTGHLQALVAHFSKAKDEDVSPTDYLKWAAALQAVDEASQDRLESQTELARAYDCYQRLMLQEGLLDFGDQVYLTLKLLRERPHVRQKLQEQYKFILVDEFQDTNHSQFELVKLLAGSRNLTVVGDDDQSIYRFRGAAISNILSFASLYPEAPQVVLRSNFRSYQPILDAAYRLIVHNNPDRLEVRNGIDKRLVAHRQGPCSVTYEPFETVACEADAVASKIAELHEEGRPYADCALLVRVNREADPYLRAFNLRSIPYRFTGNQGLYSRPEVRLATSFFRVLCDPHDSLSLFYLASSEIYQVPPSALMLLNSHAQRHNQPLLTTFQGDEEEATLQRLLEDLDRFTQLIPTESPGRILYHFLNDTGWLQQLSEEESQLQNLARFFETIKAYESINPTALLPQFLAHLDLLIEAGDSPGVVEAEGAEDAVDVLTVHKSKGLEYPAVFMVGLVERGSARTDLLEFPPELLRSPEGNEALPEERRLCYVGMTRARELLWMSSAQTKRVSRFVLEALDQPRLQVKPSTSLEKVQRYAPSMAPGRILTLSFRQVNDYLTCPLKYQFAHVLRVPVDPHHSAVYGTALHEAVSKYLLERCTLEQLWAHFDEAWSSQGFLTREHEEQRYQAGRAALERFFHAEEESPRRPALVEQEFTFPLGNNRLVGRWDRVNLENGQAVLTDYKSSEVRTQEQADRRAHESLQLGIYALAYRECRGQTPREVRLHFLDSGLVGRSPVGPERLRGTRERIEQAAAGVRQRDYPARPGVACGMCAYREICPATST